MKIGNFDTTELYKMGEVSPEQALQACMDLESKPHGQECLAEIAGFAATCIFPSMVRRFIVWQSQHGPIVTKD